MTPSNINPYDKQGNANKIQLSLGSVSPNNLPLYDPAGNLIDSKVPLLSNTQFLFSYSPGGSLSANVLNTINIPGFLGVSGSDAEHYIFITGGTGTPEAVLISGGTASSGHSGTLKFTPAYSHSGNWMIMSATAGIQEAILYGRILASSVNPFGSMYIFIPPGYYVTYATTQLCSTSSNAGIHLYGAGIASIIQRDSSFTNGSVFKLGNSGDSNGCGILIENLYITSLTTVNVIAGAAIEVHVNSITPFINFVSITNGYDGISVYGTGVHITNCNYTQEGAHATNGNSARYGLFLGRDSNGSDGPANTIISNCNFSTANVPLIYTKALQAGICIQASNGIQIESCTINGWAGIIIQNDAFSNAGINDFVLHNLIIDTVGQFGIYMQGSPTGSGFNGNITLSTLHIAIYGTPPAGSYAIFNSMVGVDFRVHDCEITGFANSNTAISMGGTWKHVIITNNAIYECSNAIQLGGGHIDVVVTGNSCGTIAGVMLNGIQILSGIDHAVISNNVLHANTALSMTGAITNSIIKNNAGVDNYIATLTSASTLVWGVNPNVTISGTAGINAVTCPLPAGTILTFRTSNGSITFNAGSSIIRTVATVQNQLYTAIWDGTYLSF